MSKNLRHIRNPYHGWYLCGYIPQHIRGVNVTPPADSDAPLCRTCAAKQRKMRLREEEIAGANGDVLSESRR